MSRSQKQAVRTLIEKKGKDLSFWITGDQLLISLVNVDAKIMSKAIATRKKCPAEHYPSQSNWFYRRSLYR